MKILNKYDDGETFLCELRLNEIITICTSTIPKVGDVIPLDEEQIPKTLRAVRTLQTRLEKLISRIEDSL